MIRADKTEVYVNCDSLIQLMEETALVMDGVLEQLPPRLWVLLFRRLMMCVDNAMEDRDGIDSRI